VNVKIILTLILFGCICRVQIRSISIIKLVVVLNRLKNCLEEIYEFKKEHVNGKIYPFSRPFLVLMMVTSQGWHPPLIGFIHPLRVPTNKIRGWVSDLLQTLGICTVFILQIGREAEKNTRNY
jgi:hypothetical protein